MKKKERRTEQRVRIEIKARIGIETVPEDGDEPIVESLLPCTISDLSLGGMRVAILSHSTMLPNLRVRLYIDIDASGEEIGLSGLVRWRDIEPGSPAHKFGVEFLVPDRETLDRWVAYTREIIASAQPEDFPDDKSDPWPW